MTNQESITRRHLLRILGTSASAMAIAPYMAKLRADSPKMGGKKLVLINLEGATDSLHITPPKPAAGSLYSNYLNIRPGLATHHTPLNLPGITEFGLHQSLGVLASEFGAGKLAIVRKTGLPAPEFSHFKAQEIMSRGRSDLNTVDTRGWLGRLSDLSFGGPLEIMGVGCAHRTDFSANQAPPIALRTIGNFRSFAFTNPSEQSLREAMLQQMSSNPYPGDDRITAHARSAVARGYSAANSLQALTNSVSSSNQYPTNDLFGLALADISRMIRGGVGTKVYYTRAAGFDTHAGQEINWTSSSLTLTQRLSVVAQALGAFITELKQAPGEWNDTTIVIFSEFGRRNWENANQGTDHGHGMNMYVLGGSVAGGLKGNPVTVSDIDIAAGQNNLPVEIDYREVFRQALAWLDPTLNPLLVFDDYAPLPGQPSFSLF